MPVVLAEAVDTYHQEVWDALEAQAPDFTLWQINPAHDYEYGTYIREEWRGEDDLVIVEHDVVPPADAIQALLDCDQAWCSHEVWLGHDFSAWTLGLVKFSRGLQRNWPELMESALPRAHSERKQVHWRSVDSAIMRALSFRGLPPHVHRPPARHLHKYPASPPAGPVPATPGRPA